MCQVCVAEYGLLEWFAVRDPRWLGRRNAPIRKWMLVRKVGWRKERPEQRRYICKWWHGGCCILDPAMVQRGPSVRVGVRLRLMTSFRQLGPIRISRKPDHNTPLWCLASSHRSKHSLFYYVVFVISKYICYLKLHSYVALRTQSLILYNRYSHGL